MFAVYSATVTLGQDPMFVGRISMPHHHPHLEKVQVEINRLHPNRWMIPATGGHIGGRKKGRRDPSLLGESRVVRGRGSLLPAAW